MAEGATFCLRRENFSSHTETVWQELRHDRNYCDVTLCVGGGHQVDAHAVILASCSPVLHTLLLQHTPSHPLLYLWGVELSSLVGLLDYMYKGVVNIKQEDLNNFLALAQELEVKGLMAEEKEELENTEEVENNSIQVQGSAFVEEVEKESFDDIKDEPMRDVGLLKSIENELEKQNDEKIGVDEKKGLELVKRMNWRDFNDGSRYSCSLCSQTFTQTGSLKRHIKSIHEGLRYSCSQCDYKATTKGHLKIHVQSIHEKIRYSCHYCEYKGTNKSNLKKHTETVHDLTTKRLQLMNNSNFQTL